MKSNKNKNQTELPFYSDKIPKEKLDRIIKTINLSANIAGIKCCAITFINDAVVRRKIQPFANNHPQITAAEHLILFFTWDKLPPKEIDLFNCLYTISNLTIIKGNNAVMEINAKQFIVTNFRLNVQNTYQALGAGLKAAALEDIGAVLIEDLRHRHIDKILQLKQNELRSVAFLALNHHEISDELTWQ